jgi:hypothetical protein
MKRLLRRLLHRFHQHQHDQDRQQLFLKHHLHLQ